MLIAIFPPVLRRPLKRSCNVWRKSSLNLFPRVHHILNKRMCSISPLKIKNERCSNSRIKCLGASLSIHVPFTTWRRSQSPSMSNEQRREEPLCPMCVSSENLVLGQSLVHCPHLTWTNVTWPLQILARILPLVPLVALGVAWPLSLTFRAVLAPAELQPQAMMMSSHCHCQSRWYSQRSH